MQERCSEVYYNCLLDTSVPKMAKKVVGFIKLQIPAGKATPAPPVGPALGQHGVNIVQFTKELDVYKRQLLSQTAAALLAFAFLLREEEPYRLHIRCIRPDRDSACLLYTSRMLRWATVPAWFISLRHSVKMMPVYAESTAIGRLYSWLTEKVT